MTANRVKKIALIGSTGSIGTNTLRVLEAHSDEFKVTALAAKKNVRLLYQQAKKFRPKMVCLYEDKHAHWLEQKLKPLGIKTVTGEAGLMEASSLAETDQVVFSLV